MMALYCTNNKRFLFVLMCMAVMYCEGSKVSKRGYPQVRQRLTAIANGMNNVLAKLSRFSYRPGLFALLKESGDTTNRILKFLEDDSWYDPPIPSVTKTQEIQSTLPNVIRIEKEPTDGGNFFTVSFPKVADIHVLHQCVSAKNSTVKEEGDVWSEKYYCPHLRDTGWVDIRDTAKEKSLKRYRSQVTITLNNSRVIGGSQHAELDLDVMARFQVLPPREVVYEPGHNADLLISAHDSYNITAFFEGIDLTSGKASPPSHPFFYRKQALANATKKMKFIAKTSKSMISGLIKVYATRKMQGPLIHKLQLSRMIIIRPSVLSTIVPPDFIGFQHFNKEGVSPFGNEMRKVKLDTKAKGFCRAYGNNITHMKVYEDFHNGTKKIATSAKIVDNGEDGTAAKTLEWEFYSRGKIRSFVCAAHGRSSPDVRGRSGRIQAQKTLDYVGYDGHPRGIEGNLTNVTVTDHPTDPCMKILTFHCAVHGSPIPRAQFRGGEGMIRQEDVQKKFNRTGDSSVLYTMTWNINVDKFRDSVFSTYGKGSLPFCEIRLLFQESAKHVYPIPTGALFRGPERKCGC